jgi:hypothetical protein
MRESAHLSSHRSPRRRVGTAPTGSWFLHSLRLCFFSVWPRQLRWISTEGQVT